MEKRNDEESIFGNVLQRIFHVTRVSDIMFVYPNPKPPSAERKRTGTERTWLLSSAPNRHISGKAATGPPVIAGEC